MITSQWRAMRWMGVMRLGVAVALLSLVYASWSSSLVVPEQRGFVRNLAWAYLLGAVLIWTLHFRWQRFFYWQWSVGSVFDLTLLSLVVFATGAKSGLGPLVPVMVAGASVLVRPRLALSLAAASTLALLAGSGMNALVHDDGDTGNFIAAGLLGAACFLAAATMSWLATRLQVQEKLAEDRGQNLRTQLSVTRRVILELEQGVVLIDSRFQIKMLNPAAQRILGEAALLATTEVPDPGPAWGSLRKAVQGLALTSDHSLQLSLPVASGESRPFRVRVLHVQDEEVKTSHASVDTLILLEDVQLLQDRAQQLKLAAMGRLSASIAHEIRNPLGAIRHANSLLSEQVQHAGVDGSAKGVPGEVAGPVDAKQKQQLRLARIIEDNTVRINTIVEDVLAIARRDRAQPEPINLSAFLPPMLEEYLQHKQIDPARVLLKLSSQEPCWFDSGHLRQVLGNLLDNALRFAPERADSVCLEWARSASGRNQLSVADAGPGIEAAHIENVFEPFYTTRSQGTGLGLFLVREWCLVNQAEIRYQRLPEASIYSGAFMIEPDQKSN